MVRPQLRSHAMARKIRKLPGGRVGVNYVRRKPKVSHCAVSKEKLRGMPRLRPSEMRKITKTQRRPNRPYGGKVSHKVLAEAILNKVIEEINEKSEQ